MVKYAVLFLVALLLACASTSGTTTTTTVSRPSDGQEAIVDNGQTNVGLAINEAAFDALTEAAVDNDITGIQQMIDTGLIILVPKNTRVLVLDRGLLKTQVRVLEGSQKGKAGWIEAEYVKNP